jgi:pimeloyl-ACP methyl ester carboxylesterase
MSTTIPRDPVRSTGEIIATVADVEICTEAFGDPRDPALLLIQGACASMVFWDEDFCRGLAAAGRYVIRFDNRDQGRSTFYPPGEPPYHLGDLADDAVGLLDHYGLPRAHVLGGSSGGMVAQLMAIRHPSRVNTLMPLCSTPEVPGAAHASAGTTGGRRSELPPPTAPVLHLIRYIADVNWADLSAAVEASLVEARVLAGEGRDPIDEGAYRAYARREYTRQGNVFSFRFNTPIAETRTPAWRDRLKDLDVPTLVLHGTADPVLPYPHGVALAREIPGARLLSLDGMGHGLPRGYWPTVIAAVLEHTSAGSAS